MGKLKTKAKAKAKANTTHKTKTKAKAKAKASCKAKAKAQAKAKAMYDFKKTNWKYVQKLPSEHNADAKISHSGRPAIFLVQNSRVHPLLEYHSTDGHKSAPARSRLHQKRTRGKLKIKKGININFYKS